MSPGGPVVTLSATYGAGGSRVGPRVADRLGVPFLDRAIPAEVSRRLAVPLDEALAHDERSQGGLGRLLAAFASVPVPGGEPPVAPALDEREFQEATERVIHAHARDGAVILGRAAAIVLADHPGALHVRLDGPAEARVAQAVRLGELDDDDAHKRQHDADRARRAYVEHFYRADPADPRHYHLVIDSTAIDLDACVELIVTAARARLGSAARR